MRIRYRRAWFAVESGGAMGGIVCKRCHGTDYVKRGTVPGLFNAMG
jgi:hypothetical protein